MNNNRIHILDSHTANQIAAGEVVERPASVVKELVENAIDAQASIIDVRVFDQECQKVQVSDNGIGMSPADMRLAIMRHATSKIRSAADLSALHSLGFRGEALPSIASVSYFTLISKQREAETGYMMTVRDGKATIPEPAAAKDGTVAIVDRLFYNTPVRKKFLRNPRGEFAAISDLLAKMAISRPDISFSLRHGTKKIFATSGSGDMEAAVMGAYGRETANHLIRVERMSPLWIRGLTSLPAMTRANRQEYNFFVNGRLVRSRELSKTVDEAYDTLLPQHRYPVTFLFLEVDPYTIDVNVHPAKLEIKFKDVSLIRRELTAAIRDAFQRKELLVPRLGTINRPLQSSASSTENEDEGFRLKQKNTRRALPFMEAHAYSNGSLYSALYKPTPSSPSWQQTPAVPIADDGEADSVALEQTAVRQQNQPETEAILVDPEPASADSIQPQDHLPADIQATETTHRGPSLCFSALRPIGQAANSFIIAEGEDGVYFIDQHAAAERILYEKILRAAAKQTEASEQLVTPLMVDLTATEATILIDNILTIREIGFIVEHFGDNSFVVRGVPFWYDGSDPCFLLRSFLEQLAAGSDGISLFRKEQLFQAACKQAIKANRRLNLEDIAVLFRELDQCEQPFTCPHGRPLIIKLTFAEIKKRFLRDGI